ncbi:MAG TPA: hypothetical protein ACFYD7_03015 [Candidatus Wujingus californicus]|uniref:hypothetical protein n=1 Tax=Candidatus Wujingus californicus TaxID=3367618 RepID=UPI001D2EED79|nr:hypothetical protein [Planctomycetota bacterium]MDO8130898.1 hypothetical protein [Candidatus Brocadiales bacterium]
MGNETSKGLSVNVKTFILVLVFVNVGFASKMIHKYYAMKEAGYIREQTFQEQLEQRVMKAFGSMEDLNKMVSDITRQKEEAEKLADSFKEQGEQLRFTNVKIEDSKSKLEEEKARLQKQIWELEDALSQGKKETLIQELTSKIEVLEKENAELKERLK